MTTNELIRRAAEKKSAIAAFNIPYLPMMEPVVRALKDTRTWGLITVARLEWIKFESKGLKEIAVEYDRVGDTRYTRLHLDHLPVIDEDGLMVEYQPIAQQAINSGYGSLMIDGSRLSLSENIEATRTIVEMGHNAGLPVEAELGAVIGHESGPCPEYEELFQSGKGFTDIQEAAHFVASTGVDWLSVAVGNIHGAVSPAKKDQKKTVARLNIDHLNKIRKATTIPLVLHGGTGIEKRYLQEAIANGIAKVNIATAIRQPYEQAMKISPDKAAEAVYRATISVLANELNIVGTVDTL